MTKRMAAIVVLPVVVLVGLWGYLHVKNRPQFERVTIAGQAVGCFQVARTAADQGKGLSGSHPAAGMVFEFPSGQRPTFWMKGTVEDLDAVWVATGVVIGVTPMVAGSYVTHPAPEPVTDVVELVPALWRFKVGDAVFIGPACTPNGGGTLRGTRTGAPPSGVGVGRLSGGLGS